MPKVAPKFDFLLNFIFPTITVSFSVLVVFDGGIFDHSLLGLLRSVNADELLRTRMHIAETGMQLCQGQSEKVAFHS